MAQTTGAVPQACAKVEIDPGCAASWVDISGQTQSVANTTQTRMSDEAYTFDGDGAIIKGGKKEPMELQFVIVYSETDTEVYQRARNSFETTGCGADICVRWSPGGGDAGDEQIYTSDGLIVSFDYPAVDASAGGPVMGSFTVKTSGTTTSIVAS